MDTVDFIASKSLVTAKKWMLESAKNRDKYELEFGKKINSMLKNKNDKLLLIQLLDQSFRSRDRKRSLEQIRHVFNKYGMAKFFDTDEKFLVWMFLIFGGITPQISLPLFVSSLREEVSKVVIKGEDKPLYDHINKRNADGIRLNLNFIGEAVLGEEEAAFRYTQYVKALQNEKITYISIKASTIYSQISSLAYEATVKELMWRLADIYRVAKDNKFKNSEGQLESKFVNLDMEEYRDMEIVYELFMRTLDMPEFRNFTAGIVIQAYIPDSFLWLKKLTEWAKKRVADGGAPVAVRLVKGANMEMEYIESSSKHWEMVTYEEKVDTDANYKQILLYSLKPENAKAVRLGVASHNIFDIAFAFETAKSYGTLEYTQFETLEGMVESIRQTIKKENNKMVVYAPVAKKDNFTNAIAYLVRRLDENTGDSNFLRYSFGLAVDTPEWTKLEGIFNESVKRISSIKNEPKRKQDRNNERYDEPVDFDNYISEVDTDFVLTQNRKWAEGIVNKWQNISSANLEYGSVIGGKETKNDTPCIVYDKSQYSQKAVVGKYFYSNEETLKSAVDAGMQGAAEWENISFSDKLKIFEKAVHLFRKNRGELIGIAAAEVGKVFTETDVEVSEAIDFIKFYPHAMKKFVKENQHLSFEPLGLGLVISPWNFPVAIPVGGIMTGLASGNAVIFKPATLSILTGRMICEIFWEAGVPKNVLQYVVAKGRTVEKAIISNPAVSFTVFTGGEDTAFKILNARPDMILSAETGGKDATIVTALADRDQAIKNVLHSAFSNSGQKCSATSLLVLEDDVFNDPQFKETLRDSADSLKVGSVWDLGNKIGTLSDKPNGALLQAIEDKNESEWLVAPRFAHDNPYMLMPSIRWGVERGSFCHKTELFGPVLSVMRAKNLNEAIDIVNETGYGLTSGLESLDNREWNVWKDKLKAGNLYINRSTTGAIVLRQPFGGLGKSAVGLGRKAGSYNYVTQFCNIIENGIAERDANYDENTDFLAKSFDLDINILRKISSNYNYNAKNVFEKVYDPMKIRGEDNEFRYLKVPGVLIRYYKGNSLESFAMAILAVKSLSIPLYISLDLEVDKGIIDAVKKIAPGVVVEDESAFCNNIQTGLRIRYIEKSSISADAYKSAYEKFNYFAYSPVVAEGRIELLNYLYEQTVSTSFHRYGNLGERKEDK